MPIQKRYSGWYSRVAVPVDLRPIFGRHELVRSLRTGSSQEARARCHHVEGRILDLFTELRRRRTSMTTDQLRALADRFLADQLDAAETMAARVIAEAAGNPVALEIRSDELIDSLTESTEQRFATKLQQRELHSLADALLGASGISVPKDSDAYNRFCLWLLKAQQDAAKAELSILRGDLSALRPVNVATRPAPVVESVLLSKAVADYQAFKQAQGAWTDQTKETHEVTYGELVALVGDKPVGKISKADLRAYYQELPKLPTYAARKWPDLNARQVIDATADQDIPRISARSINKRLVMVRSLFNWMELSDLIDRDPSEVLEVVAEDDSREKRVPFSDSEALALLARCEAEAEQPAHRFVPRILAYSGMRLDEAAQLTKADIQEIDGVWCFRINAEDGKKIKTKTARRLVPIHGAIVGELLAYRETRPEGNLWGLTASDRGGHSASLGKWLGRRVRKVTSDERKVIHSLRRSFATKLKGEGVEEYVIESLLGHTSRSMSTGRYGAPISPTKLAPVVALIEFGTTD